MQETGVVRVRVCGTQKDAAGEVSRVETEADGRYDVRGGKHYVRYADETLAEGARVDTTLKFGAEEALLIRRGALSHEQRFSLGRETRSTYRTPYGDMALAVRTQELSMREEKGRVTFQLSYDLYVADALQSHHTLCVEVVER